MARHRELRTAMGRAAREEAEQYTWDKVFARLLELYEEAIRLHRQKKQTGKH